MTRDEGHYLRSDRRKKKIDDFHSLKKGKRIDSASLLIFIRPSSVSNFST